MSLPWSLACAECGARGESKGLPSVCADCGAPWLVRYAGVPAAERRAALPAADWSMWRYREWLPLAPGETPVTLGEGGTPLLAARTLGAALGVERLWIKDESVNPTGSFKARGLAAAVTRAAAGGAPELVVPTAGNAGVATSAYGRRAGLPVTVFAPKSTPPRILEQIAGFGARLELVDGHIGDCGQAARAHAARTGAFDVSTLREPYRIEGKKTLGLEIAEQLGWRLPDVILYPTGGGTGLIGMWIAFRDLLRAGWVTGRLPRLVSVQAAGCAPVVRAMETGSDRTEPWERPETVAAGLRVPAPLGGRLILRALRDCTGTAVAVPDAALERGAGRLAAEEGVDACPEGGAVLAALELMLERGTVSRDGEIVLCNTGAGWLYRH